MPVSIEQHVELIARIIGDLRERGADDHRAHRRRPRTPGSRTTRSWPRRRCSRPPTPGTWAPTSPASRGCSCPTSASSGPTARSATRIVGERLRGLHHLRRRGRGHSMIENPYYTPEFHGEYDADQHRAAASWRRAASIPDCQLAVTTWGELNEAKDNAILITTWYSGTHQIWRDVYVGAGPRAQPRAVLHRRDQPDRQRAVHVAAQRRRPERRPGDVAVPQGAHRRRRGRPGAAAARALRHRAAAARGRRLDGRPADLRVGGALPGQGAARRADRRHRAEHPTRLPLHPGADASSSGPTRAGTAASTSPTPTSPTASSATRTSGR